MTDIFVLVVKLKVRDYSVRRQAVEEIVALVGKNKKLASAVLKLITPLFRDEDNDVKSTAIDIFVKLIEQNKELASEAHLHQLTPFLKHNNSLKQQAINAITRFIELNEQLANKETLDLLTLLIKDGKSLADSPGPTIKAFNTFVVKNKELKTEALNQVILSLKDGDSHVKKTAIEIFTGLVGRDTELATKETVTLLKPLLKDSDYFVRCTAVKILTTLVGYNKELATKENVTLLKPLLNDSMSRVRDEVTNAFAKLVEQNKELVITILNMQTEEGVSATIENIDAIAQLLGNSNDNNGNE